jgi:hypothetical protein
MLAEIRAGIAANTKEMIAKMDGNQAEMRSIFHACLTDLKDGRNETTACSEATETKPDSRLMQSTEEHQEIAKGEAVVMPVREPRKRRRVPIWRRSPARRERKGPGEIVDLGGSWLPPAARRPAVQMWHGKKETRQENWDPGKQWTAKGVLPCRNKVDPQCEK